MGTGATVHPAVGEVAVVHAGVLTLPGLLATARTPTLPRVETEASSATIEGPVPTQLLMAGQELEPSMTLADPPHATVASLLVWMRPGLVGAPMGVALTRT